MYVCLEMCVMCVLLVYMPRDGAPAGPSLEWKDTELSHFMWPKPTPILIQLLI